MVKEKKVEYSILKGRSDIRKLEYIKGGIAETKDPFCMSPDKGELGQDVKHEPVCALSFVSAPVAVS